MIYSLIIIICLIIILIKSLRNNYIDKMLSIYNRNYLIKFGYQEIYNNKGLLLMIDVNNFKNINDLYSHEVGDQVLLLIIQTLKQCLIKNKYKIIRFGGDEFLVIVKHKIDNNFIKLINEKLKQISGYELLRTPIGISIGAYYYDKEDARSAISYADIALFIAKKDKSSSNLVIFNDALHQKFILNKHLSSDLNYLLDGSQLQLVVQPIVSFSNDVKKIISFEVLSRWNHPKYGIIAPSIFTQIISNYQAKSQFDLIVLKNTFSQVIPNIPSHIRLSVNISVSTIIYNHIELIGLLKVMLLKEPDLSKRLILEITEEETIDNYHHFKEVFNEINKLGIRFALDDYGSKHANIKRLSKLYFSFIKLDKFFVEDIAISYRKQVIIKYLISLTLNLEATLVIEGVETKEELDILKELGVMYYQGYFFAEPILIEDIKNYQDIFISKEEVAKLYNIQKIDIISKELFA